MTNFFGVAPGSYSPGNYPSYNGNNPGNYPPSTGNYPMAAQPVQSGTSPTSAPGNISNILLILRLLDFYSYVRDLKEGYTLQSETRALIDKGGEANAALQLLGRINNDFAAQTMVCQLLNIVPVRPVIDTDFGNLLNLPLGRSDLKKALDKAKKLEFGDFRDVVQDLLILLDLINNHQALESILPADLKAVFAAGQPQQYPSQQPGVDGTVQTIRQLFNTFNQYDRAYLASIFGINGEVSPKSLLEYALPIADDDSDLTKAHCLVDPGSCPSEDKPAAEQPKEDGQHGIVFDGAFRLRFQDDKSVKDTMHTDRLRYKAALAATVPVVPDLIKFKLGLITGTSTSPRSPNNTMQSEVPLPRINQALVQLAPKWAGGEFSLTGGRFPLPLWLSADTVFDKDLMWDGVVANLLLKPDDNFSVFFNAGLLPLVGGTATSKGSYFFPLQAGFDIKTEPVDLSFGGSYLGYSGLKGNAVLSFRSSVTTNDTTQLPAAKAGDPPTSVYNYSYNAVIFDYQLTLKLEDGIALTHYGEYSKALNSPAGADKSYTFGSIISLFNKRLALNYSYRRLEQEAALDTNPDDDAWGGGATDISGHKFKLTGIYYQKDKSLTVGSSASYFDFDRLTPSASNRKKTLMIDFLEVSF